VRDFVIAFEPSRRVANAEDDRFIEIGGIERFDHRMAIWVRGFDPAHRRHVTRLFAPVVATLLCVAHTAAPAASPSLGQARSLPVHAADFNRDGILDIASGGDTGLRVRVSGSGDVLLPDARRVAAVTAFDVDNDGDQDLVAVSSHAALHVWSNDGRGRFTYRAARSVPSSALSPAQLAARAAPSKEAILEGSARGASPLTCARSAQHAPSHAALVDTAVSPLRPLPLSHRPGSPRSPPPALAL
jgi:hypothetical protein